MKVLDHVVTKILKIKCQYYDAIDYEPIFYNKFILHSGPPMDAFTVVTDSLRGGKKLVNTNFKLNMPMG